MNAGIYSKWNVVFSLSEMKIFRLFCFISAQTEPLQLKDPNVTFKDNTEKKLL